jgi:hypothetical protein
MVRNGAATIERWFFYEDAANLWKWARIDVFGTVLSYSAASFTTRDDCVEDARRSGYREDPVHTATLTTRAERRACSRSGLPTRL